MDNYQVKKGGKVIGRGYSTKSISELNSIINGSAPNRYSEIEKQFGKGAYALRKKYKS